MYVFQWEPTGTTKAFEGLKLSLLSVFKIRSHDHIVRVVSACLCFSFSFCFPVVVSLFSSFSNSITVTTGWTSKKKKKRKILNSLFLFFFFLCFSRKLNNAFVWWFSHIYLTCLDYFLIELLVWSDMATGALLVLPVPRICKWALNDLRERGPFINHASLKFYRKKKKNRERMCVWCRRVVVPWRRRADDNRRECVELPFLHVSFILFPPSLSCV